ncbi:MAG: dTDP-4-dehydrorhamnose reductase [Bdellovibrionota bacterium]
MRALVTGAGGALGKALAAQAPERVECLALSRQELDVADEKAVARIVHERKISCVVNAAAYTDVDGAEERPGEAFRSNALGAEVLAKVCASQGALFVHVSTDYVFDGARGGPYPEEAAVNPLSVYAQSKLEGEERVRRAAAKNHLIVRTSWLYGDGGNSFPHKVLSWAKSKEAVELVEDQFGSPTYAAPLARTLWELALRGQRGLLHFAGEGRASRFEFGSFLIAAAKKRGIPLAVKEVKPVPSSRFPLKAPRPSDSSLCCRKLAQLHPDLAPAGWKEMADEFVGKLAS